MNILRNIFGVARYERIMLMRTTRFRALGLIGISIPTVQGIGLAIAETQGWLAEGGQVSALGLSGFVPFYMYTYFQTILIAFVAGNFRAVDERANVEEVISSRPLTTAELVTGKYVGVVQALTTLSLCVLVLTLAIQAAKMSITGDPFLLTPYLAYFALMTFPALIFMSALTFFLGATLRNTTATALVSIAYIIAVLFFLGTRYGGIFDFGAFFAPLYFSDMAGLGDVTRVLQIRVFYLTLSVALLGLSIASYPRLPKPGLWSKIGHVMAVAGIGGAAILYISMAQQDIVRDQNRTELFAVQLSHADMPVVDVLTYDLNIEIMKNRVPLAATVEMELVNDNELPLETMIFTLNPGLVVSKVVDMDGRDLLFEIEGSVIEITPSSSLAPGNQTTIRLTYAGDIDRNGFDLLRTAARIEKWQGPIHKGDLTAWIREDSAYLPPRSRWYPVPGVDYGNHQQRPVSFSTGRITIDAPAGLEAITQGVPTSEQTEAGRSRSVWQINVPVPQLSLNLSAYEVFTTDAAGTEVALYIHPLHVRQVSVFEDAIEEIDGLVEQLLTTMAQETGLPYPYKRLAVVEVPFLVQWYYEGWEENGGLTQPGILMVEEDTLVSHLKRMTNRVNRTMGSERGQGQDPARLKRDQIAAAVFSVFLSPEGYSGGLFRSPLVQLWSFNRGFTGENSSLLARGMPVYMQEDLTQEIRSSMFQDRRGGGDGRNFAAMAAMSRSRPQDHGASMQVRIGGDAQSRPSGPGNQTGGGATWDEMLEAMQTKSLAELDPDADPDLYRSVLDAKGLTMFRMIEAVVGSDEFINTLESFGKSSQYKDVSFEEFERAVVPEGTDEEDVSRQGLDRLINDWVNGTYVPGYTLTRSEAKKREDDQGKVVYQVMVRILNGEPGRGFVQVQLQGRGDEITKNVEIEGGQEVEVSMVIGVRPHIVTVEPFLAKNRRPLRSPLRVGEEVEPGLPEEYVALVTAEEAAYTEIIVDNEDEGFSMPVRRVQRYMRPGLEGGNWNVQANRIAFGRYETNYRSKSGGDGAQPAVWTTTLPYAGEYDVSYYFLTRRINGRDREGFRGAADYYSMTINHSGETTELTVNTDQLDPGWNALGRFTFEAGEEARVELSDLAEGNLYADAVRWRYVDPNNPNVVYDEGIMPWEWGFGGGGNRGGRGGR
jgi:ABC-type transport system involved in multi-copper enzyme maturation permease subunit